MTTTLSPAGADFRASFLEAADRAVDAAGAVDHDLTLGVRLRFAGDALVPAVLTPFAHLLGPAEPTITIVVWDSASTGVRFGPPVGDSGVAGRGEMPEFSGDGVSVAVDGSSGQVSLWDAARRLGVVWIASAEQLPWWERVGPLRMALSLALGGPRRDLVHAAAVGTERGGALVGGPSGSGKSTTAVACHLAGLRFAGEDLVLLDAERLVAQSVHRTAKLLPDALDLVPAARDHVWPVEAPKTLLLLDDVAPEVELTHVLVPRVVDDAVTDVRPLGAAAAVRSIAPSTIFQFARPGGAQLGTLADAARQLECLELRLGRDGRAADVVREVLAA